MIKSFLGKRLPSSRRKRSSIHLFDQLNGQTCLSRLFFIYPCLSSLQFPRLGLRATITKSQRAYYTCSFQLLLFQQIIANIIVERMLSLVLKIKDNAVMKMICIFKPTVCFLQGILEFQTHSEERQNQSNSSPGSAKQITQLFDLGRVKLP